MSTLLLATLLNTANAATMPELIERNAALQPYITAIADGAVCAAEKEEFITYEGNPYLGTQREKGQRDSYKMQVKLKDGRVASIKYIDGSCEDKYNSDNKRGACDLLEIEVQDKKDPRRKDTFSDLNLDGITFDQSGTLYTPKDYDTVTGIPDVPSQVRTWAWSPDQIPSYLETVLDHYEPLVREIHKQTRNSCKR